MSAPPCSQCTGRRAGDGTKSPSDGGGRAKPEVFPACQSGLGTLFAHMPPQARATIAAASSYTAAAGTRIAAEGGNAVDIATAAALTASVAEVLLCSLGGSAFILVSLADGPPELYDGADVVPGLGCSARRPGRSREVHLPYGDGVDVLVGHGSVAVPGALAAIELAWQRRGSLPWSQIVAPAFELARDGFRLGGTAARWLNVAGEIVFKQQEASRRCFFTEAGRLLQEGEMVHIAGLAETLELIAREGARVFYEGDPAAAFAADMADQGGLVTREDLAAYKAVVRSPLSLRSGGFQLSLNPAPAAGGSAVAALIRLLERGWTAESSLAEGALRNAQAQVQLIRLRDGRSDPEALADLQAILGADQVLAELAPTLRSNHTTHFSVATKNGDIVAVSMSMGYGAGVTIPATGIACGNGLGEPELHPAGFDVSSPGSRLVSNMAPTVARHTDGRCLGLGSPGASRITTAIAQTWIQYALGGRSFAAAVTAPRLHVERWHDGLRVQCEPGVDISLLSESGFIVRPFDEPHMYFGAVQLAGIDQDGLLHAVADTRRVGAVETV